jgi:type IV pilus assembly protein PilF
MKNDKAAEELSDLAALQLRPTNTQALSLACRYCLSARAAIRKPGSGPRISKKCHGANTPEVMWLALRIERKLGNREAEARYASQLRRRFPGSPEHRAADSGPI